MIKTAIHAGVWSADPEPENVTRVLAEVAATGFDCLAWPLRSLSRLRPATLAAAFGRAGVTALGTTGLPAGADLLDQSHRGRLDEGSLDLCALAEPVRLAGYDGLIGVEAFSRARIAPDHANLLSVWRNQFEDGTALARQAMNLIREIFGSVTGR